MKKKQRIKKALVSSALALILCVSMLVGNTFAWFTDTASTGINKIQAGTLKVDLQKLTDDGTWVSVEGETLDFVKATVNGKQVDQEILWEPGCTYSLPTVKVVNKGNLALKYVVQISGFTGNNEDGVDLSEVLELSMSVNGTKVFPKEEEVVTLKDALTSQDPDGFAHGNLEAGKDSGELTISLHMQKTAGNEYQGKTIDGIYVTVFATQDTVEYDSTTDQYDANAFNDTYAAVTTVEEIYKAIEGGKSFINVTEDISGGRDITQDDNAVFFFAKTEREIQSGKINNLNMADQITLTGSGTVSNNDMIIWADGSDIDITIAGGTYVNEENGYHIVYANKGAKVTITGGTFIHNGQEAMFNVNDETPGTIIIQGGLYNINPTNMCYDKNGGPTIAFQAKDAYKDETGRGIKLADGYKVVKVEIDGATWYKVVPETNS